MKQINITNSCSIGPDTPSFIIAEVGANHNRSIALAKEHIDAAVEAGADAVKFQIYSAETLYSKKEPLCSDYTKDLCEFIKKIESPRTWIPCFAVGFLL